MSVSAEHLRMPHDMGKLLMMNVTIIAVAIQRKCAEGTIDVHCGNMVISQLFPLQGNTLQ